MTLNGLDYISGSLGQWSTGMVQGQYLAAVDSYGNNHVAGGDSYVRDINIRDTGLLLIDNPVYAMVHFYDDGTFAGGGIWAVGLCSMGM